MSDGGWYGYPPQEPDPYSQPQDYGNAPQTPEYDQYGRPIQPSPQHRQHYQQQQPQGQQPQQPHPQQPQQQYSRPEQQYSTPEQQYGGPEQQQRPRPQQPQQPQGQAPGQGQPQYRQQRPPQRPRQQQPQQQAQNPYFQQQQQQRQQQDYGYDPNAGSGSYGSGYEGYPQQGYDTGGYPRQDYERSGYDTATGSASPGYGSAASYEAASYGSGSYDTGNPRGGYGSGGHASQPQPQSQPSYSAGRDPYADLSELAEEPDEYEYPSRGRRRAGGTGEQSQVSDDGRLGLLGEDSANESPASPGVDEDDEDGGRRRGGRSGGKQKDKDKKARRSCTVIFLFFALIAGGLGYGGYQGYNWYEAHYGPPADYNSTSGISATTIVTIPSGAGGTEIAQKLYAAGVVKSERAFIEACNNNSQCPNIQANTYKLHEQMSAAAAVTAMLNSSNVYNKSQLLVKPGERAADVFTDLEQKTSWTQAQIVSAINSGQIDLPSYATAKTAAKYPFANIEGFLYTGTYQLPGYKTPTALLKAMVDQQVAMFNAVGLTQKASSLNMTPYQVLTVASMARAEAGSDPSDLAKISGVIYTRLKNSNYSKLGFDTATLYGLGRTEPQPTAAELADKSNPYNLRVVRGLPPGPIDSADQPSLMGALSPTDSTDVYFCAVNGAIHYASNDTAWAQLGKQYPGNCG
ncbi:endolytic transglycosylase MltG [Actinospica sp.]|uniref:endolytic transglycosylase MltG n=1 Tax=Actinospica sp. TaxID=1872142 RepID=UPI002CC15BEB|nr:endolytic transglycosylase MltG [Actinospica sp.]HWG28461.1 endolytic transglycosylase MltG [Actinospica sp.]